MMPRASHSDLALSEDALESACLTQPMVIVRLSHSVSGIPGVARRHLH